MICRFFFSRSSCFSLGVYSRHKLSTAGLLLFSFLSVAQNDSTLLLAPERLGEQHIVTRSIALQNPKALSATRSVEDVSKLPFTIWTVTAEDILRYGFVTLGDVLRAAPGIRVSQPGNAEEGETFLMRGLSGNEYVKILINDVPVKAVIALGMSIGAQLPIRQAERIEVIYGPAGVLYGNEAFAGVVNIILKETERPVFAQADLSFGNNGYNNLDLMFGGKLGRDKRIFRFSLYGSSTVRERADLYQDELRTHNPSYYYSLGITPNDYYNNPNFRPERPNQLNSKLAPIPHESRLFGINLTWRGIHFTYHRMNRSDHSALGRNLMAVSWSNSSDHINERVETFSLGFKREPANKKWALHNTVSAVRYQVENTSTTTYLFDQISLAEYYVTRQFALSENARQALRSKIFEKYASNERYATANTLDIRIESRMQVALRANLYLDAGVQVNTGLGTPLSSYYPRPIEVPVTFESRPGFEPLNIPSGASSSDINFLSQLTWKGKRLFLLGAGSLTASSQIEGTLVPSFRAAGLYRFDSVWSIYANGSTGFRLPSEYAKAHSFTFYEQSSVTHEYGIVGEGEVLQVETIHSMEGGIRWSKRQVAVNGSFFYEKAYNLLRPGYLYQQPGSTDWYYGYKNAPGLALSMWGIQGLISSKKQVLSLNSGRRNAARITGHTEFFFQYARGKEWFGEPFESTNDVRNAPRWMTQFRTFTTIGKVEVMLASNLQKAVLSKATTYKNLWERSDDLFVKNYPRFRSWDMMLRFYFSKQLVGYIHLQNMFNRQLSGLDATGTVEDLNFPVQQGRLFRFGVNYNLGE